MRILLTKKGQEAMKKFNTQEDGDFNPVASVAKLQMSPKTITAANSPKKKKSPHHSGQHTKRNLNKDGSVSNLMDIYEHTKTIDTQSGSRILTLEHDYSNPMMGTSKQVNIKTNTVNIGKVAKERYNTESSGQSLILPNIKFNTEGNDQDQSVSALNQEFTIKEIIGSDKYKQIKDNVVKSYLQKQKHFVINANNFRTNDDERNYLQHLENNLSSKITADKMNLINYLSHKNQVSNVLVKKLANANENQILKMNKACQINNHFQELNELFERQVQNVLFKKQGIIALEYKKNLQAMGNYLEKVHNRLNSYEGYKTKNEEAYRDRYLNMQRKYWNLKIDHLYNPKKKSENSLISDRSTLNINQVKK